MRKQRMMGAAALLWCVATGAGGCIDAVREGTTAGISAATETIITMAIEGIFEQAADSE